MDYNIISEINILSSITNPEYLIFNKSTLKPKDSN